MHKLVKGLKKKKKQKKGKKGEEEDEFDPEELERYRRERAEAQQKAEQSDESQGASNASSDEWKKFEALTAGVDSILKKTQGDLDRIKSTSFFQRKPPLGEQKKKEEEEEESEEQEEVKSKKSTSSKWVGFDEEGNPTEGEPPDAKKDKEKSREDGLVEVPDDEDEPEYSAEDDIFDTTYAEILQNFEISLAYLPDSPTEEAAGDDPFDTTNAEKVLKTVDKKGKKLVSLGNAVEILAGRVDYTKKPVESCVVAEPVEVEKTLLDDDTDIPDIPVDLTKVPLDLLRQVNSKKNQEDNADEDAKPSNGNLDISEFDILQDKDSLNVVKDKILEEIPDLDDAEFDIDAEPNEAVKLEEVEDPFATKEPETVDFETEAIVEASFEAATFVDEEDPFDTTFAENILPGKTELKFIEKELEELPVSEVTISLTDPAGLNRDYETGLLKEENETRSSGLQLKRDLLGGSTTDLSQLVEEPIAPVEEITYVDPFDVSQVKEIPPGKGELKFLEKELLGERPNPSNSLEDDDFDPRKDEQPEIVENQNIPPRPPLPIAAPIKPTFKVDFEEEERPESGVEIGELGRRTSRPEVLELAPTKAVAFELPTPSKRPDLLATSEEEKTLPSKPLTPYYSQKSIEEVLPIEEEEIDVDPFDTSFVAKVAPGKTELKLIESELLKQETKLPHSLSDHDFDPRAEGEPVRRQKVQQSLLDERIEVDAKPLTPRIESKVLEKEEEEISYVDPFDTSIAADILPGKAELKILEKEKKVSTDFLCIDDQGPEAKVLTPLQNEAFAIPEDVDPFDTSFAVLGPGKTELKLLESELMKK
ncbi:Protein stoned-A [Habropoda laboriosa]|uniref:Protein stoned-A n=1 Tax=Habropoda laboriosa TaxID=597456 RepID=A0A0L7QVB0_9HYME|nr:Protein stoned-A [Habropoda laboriosa]